MADVPKIPQIPETAYLDEAYPIINQSIEYSNEALANHATTDLKADEAIETANTAKQTAEQTRSEIRQSVGEAVISYEDVAYMPGHINYLGVYESQYTAYSSKKISVKPGDELLISTYVRATYGALAAFFDINGSYIGYTKSVQETGIMKYVDEAVTVPENCYYVGISTSDISINPIVIKKIQPINIKSELSKLSQSVTYENYVLSYEDVAYVQGIYTRQGIYESQHTTYKSKKITVEPGIKLLVSLNARASWGALAVFFDANNTFLGYYKSVQETGVAVYKDEPVTIPANCYSVAFTTYDSVVNPIIIQKVESKQFIAQEFIATNEEVLQNVSNQDLKIQSLEFDNPNLEERIKALEKYNEFAWGNFDKGYAVIIIDDGVSDLSTFYTIFQEYNVPLSCAIPTNVLNITVDSGLPMKDLLLDIEATGGEILSHGLNYDVFTDTTTEEVANYRLRESKRLLAEVGLTINGFVKPGGSGALPTLGKFEHLVRKYYRYGYSSGDTAAYSMQRAFLGDSLEVLKSHIDKSITNKTSIAFYGHSFARDVNETTLRGLIEYINANTGIQLVTTKYLYDTFGTTVLEKLISGLN
jgi:peptidoglycan/xylan/chitin deacetylase (PgdA/CDA1 family)